MIAFVLFVQILLKHQRDRSWYSLCSCVEGMLWNCILTKLVFRVEMRLMHSSSCPNTEPRQCGAVSECYVTKEPFTSQHNLIQHKRHFKHSTFVTQRKVCFHNHKSITSQAWGPEVWGDLTQRYDMISLHVNLVSKNPISTDLLQLLPENLSYSQEKFLEGGFCNICTVINYVSAEIKETRL